jgi:signal transduction histidine kinase/ActR/RegA family two-component response regulator
MNERTLDDGHVVQFYDGDASLIDALTSFVATGLSIGEACLVIATPEHREDLESRLGEAGVDLDRARATGAYVALDAALTLARITVDDMPDPGRLAQVMNELLARVGPGRERRVFGEMVGLLLTRGSIEATLRLEALWNGLRETHPFRLFCAYPISRLGDRELAGPIAEICTQHSRVVPAESFPRHGSADERLRAIVRLQQQASSLQAEVEERHAVEAALRVLKEELETQVEDLRRLHDLTVRLTGTLDFASLLREILHGAMAVEGTELGLLSLRDPERPGLVLGAHAGFREEFLKTVERVPPGSGGCGTAYRDRRPLVIEDVETDPIFAPYRETARLGGFRACHSTPLFTRHGDIIGVLSVHFAEPHRPAERKVRLMDLYARIAADSIENARLHRRLQQELEDRKQSLAREHLARAEAETANRMKDEFLATVSHELRTPLNAILGWAHVLRTGLRDEATVARGVEVIERNAQAQAQLIEDILDASRVITGSLRLTRGPVDLATVINRAIDSVRLAAQGKGIELAVALDPTAGHLDGDASRLQQVVWNLVSNAVKFTHLGGRVEVRLTRAGDSAQIRVTDSGEGIAADFLPFIFDRFRQADSTITRRHGGLGLGLAIVRHLVALHDGTVDAESAGPGYGAAFTIRLPLSPARDPAAPARDVKETSPLRDVHVLVVDDDRDALDMLTVALSAAGARVRTAASAGDALALLRWIRPDVLVSDLAMPDEDGYSFIRDVRAIEGESGRRTPAIALSAYVRVQDRARAVAAGFNMFVEKPVDPEELISVIAGVTERRDQQGAQSG